MLLALQAIKFYHAVNKTISKYHQKEAPMSRLIAAVLVVMISTPLFAAEPPKTEEQKTLYAIGLIVARQLAVFSLNPEEFEVVKQGIVDAVTGKKPEIEVAAYNEKVQELVRARRKVQGDKLSGSNKEFLENAAKTKGAVKTDSGLVYLSLKEGEGAVPGSTDTVKVNYRGTLPDGKEFDSSYKRGKPVDFRVDGVIKCWGEGLKMMKVGGKAKLICPSSIAYGDAGAGELILPGATLVFEVELLGIKPEAKQSSPAK
jgi:FKBP-type peptidyl-prolyl cis-trans isomerase FkpA